MIGRIRRLLNGPEPDFLPGDPPGELVRVPGIRGVGLLESVDGDHGTVAFGKGRKEIVPLSAIKRVTPRGGSLDRRLV